MNTLDSKALEGLGLSSTQANGRANEKGSLGQAEFLKLMTAQLNNQDPTKPMEGGEFFSQIAQFSTVAGIQELQSSFEQVATAMYSSQVLQASTMVGRSVLIPTSQVTTDGQSGVEGVVELPSSTNKLSIDIYDVTGQLINRVDMGSRNGGETTFNWDGRDAGGKLVPAGSYQIKAEAQYGGETVGLNTYLAAKVESVSVGSQGQGVTLNLAGQGAMPVANIKRVM